MKTIRKISKQYPLNKYNLSFKIISIDNCDLIRYKSEHVEYIDKIQSYICVFIRMLI